MWWGITVKHSKRKHDCSEKKKLIKELQDFEVDICGVANFWIGEIADQFFSLEI